MIPTLFLSPNSLFTSFEIIFTIFFLIKDGNPIREHSELLESPGKVEEAFEANIGLSSYQKNNFILYTLYSNK